MTRRHSLLLVGILLTLCVGGLTRQPDVKADAAKLPAKLTDRQFWRLSNELSEPNGSFRSDNLLSNEIFLQTSSRISCKRRGPDRVYLGVGPEQNFTYIAALRPRMAFIVDVRRGNLQLHLMYKALFELSKDRAEFVSRLFSKPRPDGPRRDSRRPTISSRPSRRSSTSEGSTSRTCSTSRTSCSRSASCRCRGKI